MPIRPHPSLFLAAAVLLLVAGCRSHREAASRPLPEGEGAARPAPVYRTANFSCTVAGATATGQLRMMQDSVLWGSVVKIVELGRLKATPDSVIVYAKVVGRCFRGTYDDLYHRFHYRTTFAEVQRLLTGADANAQLEAIARTFNTEAVFRIEPWKEVSSTTFPIAIPPHVTNL